MIKAKCSGCDKEYSIPKEKVPEGKTLELPCPKCKTIIVVKRESPSGTEPDTKEKLSGEALLKYILKTSKALPPMPQIMAKATEVMSDDNAGFKEVGDVLETDQAMATRVLKLANSAYYGLSVPVSSVQQASALLGFQTLIELITVVSTSKMMGQSLMGYGVESNDVWKHSLSVGIGAKLIAEKKFPVLMNDAFNAGLIHDSGMLILDTYVVKEKAVFDQGMQEGRAVQDIEKEVFGFDHAEIASDFFTKWKLPKTQTFAIRHHHKPSQSNGNELSYIIHGADYLAMKDSPDKNFILEDGALDFLGIGEDDIEVYAEEIRAAVEGIVQSVA